MTVTCPSCNTKFSVDVSLLKKTQQKMRCSKCENVFVFAPAESEADPSPVQQGASTPTFAEIAAQMGIEDTQDQQETAGQRSAARKGLKGVKAAVIILVVLILCAGGYLYWTNYWRSGDRWLRINRLAGQEVVVQDGRAFLVSGVISNGSTKGRKSIILRVKLFDHDGKVIIEKDALAGMLLSKQQIPALMKTDIQKRVAAFKLSPAETFRVEAGREIPFSVPFLDEDFAKAKEFTVEIIQSSYQ